MLTARVEMSAADRAHEQNDGHHHECGSDHPGPVGNGVAAEASVYHSSADSYENEEKGSEQFGQEGAAFVVVVPEVELSDKRVGAAQGADPG
jgi:hypothetical protein